MNIEKHNDFKRLAAMHQTGRTTPSFICCVSPTEREHVRRLLAGFHSPKQKIAWIASARTCANISSPKKREHQNYNCQWLAELASDRFLQPPIAFDGVEGIKERRPAARQTGHAGPAQTL